MKKVILFIKAMLLVFCIVPISTTQAMPQRAQEKDSFAPAQPNTVLSVFNQRKISGMVVELNSLVPKDNIPGYGLQEPHETTIAQSGKPKTTPPKGKPNPHVKRSGHGRSTMGDNVTEKDDKDDGDENEEAEESEESGDDSAIKYNKGLKNSSGYNKDL